ncbi:hypothetical protein [Dactylosporangium sp. NPDC051484]|uniref:hypothetical protein n=1 Tax=Dactylosporangium sp. NPDC051484 TaxID=3154942 RepID=UPI00344B7403
MTTNNALSPSRLTLGLALIVAGSGVLTQFLVGVPGFPKIPPGPIILGVAGIIVLALGRSRWPLVVGLLAALFVTLGGLIEGSVWSRIGNPGQFDVWIGVALQWVGLVGALITAVLALTRAYSRARTPAVD